MSAALWTPEPWRVVEEDDAIAHWYRVEVGTPPRRVFKMSDAADARLIAAAPEMAAHLAHMVSEWENRVEAIESGRAMDDPDAVIERNARHSARLLARIRGETP